jgi:hypothetical protein
MENSQEKMHLMISSAVSVADNTTLKVYETTSEKYNFRAIQSVKDAMLNSSPSLIAMEKKDKTLTENILKLMIAKTARSFNLTRNIEPAQIVDLVTDLKQDFYFLKLSEVFFVLKEARMGKMGKLYERIDQPTIITWFYEYVDKRMEIAEEESLRQHDQHTYMEKDRSYDKFIINLQDQQDKTEQKRISNLAYEMAKKMNVNKNE